MQSSWMLLKFHSGIFRLFRNAKNRKFRENVVTARAELFFLRMAKCFLRAFVIVPLTFYSSMRQSYDTGCASPSDAQFHRTLSKRHVTFLFLANFAVAFIENTRKSIRVVQI